MRQGQNRGLFRGDVYFTRFEFVRPNEEYEYKDKFVVVLREDPAAEHNVPVVLANTFRIPREPFDWEVFIPPQADRFPAPTYIDCRWVYTLVKRQIGENYRFPLSTATMREVDLRLMKGLQMKPLPSEPDTSADDH